jgi:cyclohexadienyl dehydratase
MRGAVSFVRNATVGLVLLVCLAQTQLLLAQALPEPAPDPVESAAPATSSPTSETAGPSATSDIDRSSLAVYDEPDVAAARVLDAINDRLSLMPAVAAVKWMSGAPVSDPDREAEVLDQAAARALELGLDVPAVRLLFAEQIRLARESQQRLHDEWRASGVCPPCNAPINLTGLRTAIDAVNEGLLIALYLAAPVAATAPGAETLFQAADALWAAHVPAENDRRALADAVRSVRRTAGAGWERIKASGILRIGTTGDYAPFSLEADGKLRGADIQLALDLALRLKLLPIFVRTTWPTLLQDLQADRFDVALSGISFTAERAAVAQFSDPYQQGGKTILARCTERDEFENLAEVDRPGVRVIVNPGGTNERYVRESLHEATIVVHPDNRTIFDEIVADRADVMITDDIEVELQTRRHPELCRAFAGTLTQGDKRILMANDKRLHEVVNSWLALARLAGIPRLYLESAMIEHAEPPRAEPPRAETPRVETPDAETRKAEQPRTH